MKRTLPKLLAHAGIVLSLVLIALLIVDHINPSMDFINNEITKALMGGFSLLGVTNSLLLLFTR